MHGAAAVFKDKKEDLSRRLESASMPATALLGNMRLLDDLSRHTSQYQDPRYLPFYYHFGRVFAPRRLLFVGLDIGLHLACMLKGCSNPESASCIQPRPESFYSPRLAMSNARSAAGRKFPLGVYVGHLNDQGAKDISLGHFDAAAVTAEMASDSLMDALDFCWSRLSEGGFLCVDRLSRKGSREVFDDLTSQPAQTMRRIYEFLGEDPFDHNFVNVEQVTKEDDINVHRIPGLHTIRPAVMPVPRRAVEILGSALTQKYSGAEVWRIHKSQI